MCTILGGDFNARVGASYYEIEEYAVGCNARGRAADTSQNARGKVLL